MYLKATTKFIFTGDGWDEELEQMAEDDFVWYYNRYIDVFNSHIEEINSEWDRLYKGNKNEYMGDGMVVIYNHFVAAKMQKYLIELNINGILLGAGWIISVNPETAVCRLYLQNDINSYLDFEINIE